MEQRGNQKYNHKCFRKQNKRICFLLISMCIAKAIMILNALFFKGKRNLKIDVIFIYKKEEKTIAK